MSSIANPTSLDQESKPIREYRLIPEPSLDEDHVVIRVNHPFVGRKTRLFPRPSMFSAVYDWITSISEDSFKYFEIQTFDSKVVYPSDETFSGVFKIIKTLTPALMSSDGEVAFQGYGVVDLTSESEPSNSKLIVNPPGNYLIEPISLP